MRQLGPRGHLHLLHANRYEHHRPQAAQAQCPHKGIEHESQGEGLVNDDTYVLTQRAHVLLANLRQNLRLQAAPTQLAH